MKHIRITSLDRPAPANSGDGSSDKGLDGTIIILDGFRGLLGSLKALDVAL